jgi:hypothetical protein
MLWPILEYPFEPVYRSNQYSILFSYKNIKSHQNMNHRCGICIPTVMLQEIKNILNSVKFRIFCIPVCCLHPKLQSYPLYCMTMKLALSRCGKITGWRC